MQTFDKDYLADTNDESDLVLKHRLLIRILILVASFAIALALTRLFYPDPFMLTVDIIFTLVSFIAIYFLKKSVKNTPIVTNIILIIFFILVLVMFMNDEKYLLGPSWFIVLVMFSFYQAGILKGILITIASFISILILGQNLIFPYSTVQYLYVLAPFLVAALTTYLYELKVKNKEELLDLKNIAQTQLIQEKEDLLQHAYYDELTKLPNRVLFHDRLKQAVAKTNRSNKDFAVLFIDLDQFKEINDSHGHTIGDSVLCEIASRLENTLRKEDTIARFGGDEFLCIVEQLESCESVAILATKLINATKEPMHMWGDTFQVTCSIGISIYKKDAKNEEVVLHHADTAMYKAKALGKDNYQFYEAC